jgi:hypothetical protein
MHIFDQITVLFLSSIKSDEMIEKSYYSINATCDGPDIIKHDISLD